MWRNAYVESTVLSADPLELVRLLYGGALEAVRDARRRLAAGEVAARSAAITKAMAIVAELSGSLNRDEGGEISRNLAELYDYVLRKLQDANLRQADEPLAEALELLSTLSEAWQGVRPAAPAETPATALPVPAVGSMWQEEPALAAEAPGWSL
jgi:flagellar protein FliS